MACVVDACYDVKDV